MVTTVPTLPAAGITLYTAGRMRNELFATASLPLAVMVVVPNACISTTKLVLNQPWSSTYRGVRMLSFVPKAMVIPSLAP